MKTTADRPPLVRFLLAFAGLIAVALSLAALSPSPAPAPERRSDDAPASTERRVTADDPSATRTGRDMSADRR